MDKRLDLESPAMREGAAHGAGMAALEPVGQDVAPRDGVMIEIEADPTLGYASIQNAVPVLRSLRLINRSQETFENVEVQIRCNPAFAQPVRLRFDAGARRNPPHRAAGPGARPWLRPICRKRSAPPSR